MKSIVVTGIDGFLGYNFFNCLKDKYEIIGFVRDLKALKRLRFDQLRLYDSLAELEKCIATQRISAIVHFATSYRDENKTQQFVNIELPGKLFDIAVAHKIKVFLNTDTFISRLPQEYDYLTNYSRSKKECRLLLGRKKGITKPIHMVIHHMYGPYDSPRKFIMQLFRNCTDTSIKNMPLTTGKQSRDFIYVDDVVTAFDAVLDNHKIIPRNQSIDVCTGHLATIGEVVELTKKITHSQIHLGYGELSVRKGEPDMKNIKYSNEYLKSVGWKPQFSLKQGISEVYKWYINA